MVDNAMLRSHLEESTFRETVATTTAYDLMHTSILTR